MAWDFATDPEFDKKLEWIRTFVHDEILPLETLDLTAKQFRRATDPLKERVKNEGLWAAHLPPELGGHGFGQVALGLMHEILGQCRYAPAIFGNNAPDSGNAELLALAADEAQRERWMRPLLDGTLRSCFCMTEPGAGSDPTMLTTRAVRDGESWIINGHKWFASNASTADFHIVMCVTNPEADAHHKASMIIVPAGTPGVEIVRDIPSMDDPLTTADGPRDMTIEATHAEIRYTDVRVPVDHLIGEEGAGFALAQKRLGPGRIHHCMRWLGQAQRAFDMLCERAVSRTAHGSRLSDKQFVQDWVATSAAEIEAARLLTLKTAWTIDRVGAANARTEISMIKFWGSSVLYNVIDRAIQVHGSLGFTTDLPLEHMYRAARAARIYDGPDEVHKVTVARRILRRYEPNEVPSEHVPTRRVAAKEKFAELLAAAE